MRCTASYKTMAQPADGARFPGFVALEGRYTAGVIENTTAEWEKLTAGRGIGERLNRLKG